MPTEALLIVNVDSDPDPVSVPQTDADILAKYRAMQAILASHANGAGAWCVLTGPVCRDRFVQEPFLSFWRELRDAGADLVLHPEEDLYGPPPGKVDDRSSYENIAHMRPIILEKARQMRAAGLPFAAYRGGYHGFTPAIGAVLKEAGIPIDLACGPGIAWPEKAAAWANAPLSAYYMAADVCDREAGADEHDPLFEIPFAWDGVAAGTSRRFVIGENYMINDFSTLEAMRRVWAAVLARREAAARTQIVSMICHTFTMGQAQYEDQLAAILDHVRGTGGRIVTPTTARAHFDREADRA